jgi:serine/threonine protein kinase
MHQYKIAHRDLKPANILLKNGKAKITDFGLACKFSKEEMLQAFVGTPLHMAP